MKNNNEQVMGWYNSALEINQKVYGMMQEAFADNETVSFSVGVNLWNDFVSINAFMFIGHGNGVMQELRELVGNASASLTLNSYTEPENVEKYYGEVADAINGFKRRAEIVKTIINKKKGNEQ